MSEDLTKRLPPGDKDEILTAIKNLDSRTNNLDTRLGSLDTRLGSLDTRLGSLEQKVDERLYDTRPMWHKLEADITQLQAGVERLEKGQVELRDHILDFGRAVRDLIVIRL